MSWPNRIAVAALLGAGSVELGAARVPLAVACSRLRDMQVPNTTIQLAQEDSSPSRLAGRGERGGRGAGGRGAGRGAQPATSADKEAPICRVRGSIAPTPTSRILFELWLPLSGWNGKFAAVGNSGWAGGIVPARLAEQLKHGYAVAETNTGHRQAPDLIDAARFAFEQPEQLVDYAYRSEHELTVVAKAIVEQFYGKRPAFSYWIGSSTGGKQGLIEAQRYPADYDGILAVAPPLQFTTLKAAYLHKLLVAARESATYLPDSALRLLHEAVLTACDNLDGVPDGVLTDPRRCMFSPASIRCGAGQPHPRCLSPAQVTAAAAKYDGLKDPRTGSSIAHGLSRGSELKWGPEIDPADPNPRAISYFRWLVFRDSTWDWTSFDFSHESDLRAFLESETRYAPVFNGTNPNLHAFERRGGKILHVHGWNDEEVPALYSIDYFESVISAFDSGRGAPATVQDVQRFYRLFLAPGRGHGAGAVDPSLQAALEQWVERGIAPDEVTTSHAEGGVESTQLLCPYPKAARYSGKGDPTNAKNFACAGSPRP